ncbi:ATP-dependent zinc protease family protein [Maritalea sp.]|uniref:ATP-dependent zinc protease family protein n=1 Tax=Maritalea sp. TaxID=2003361 RepID=UPI003EF0FA03
MKNKTSPREREVIGWREHIGLPNLGISRMAAKIDTGARTSALHAEEQELFERDGQRWVRFKAPKLKNHPACLIEAPLKSEREIKNTSGIAENRFVIRTLLMLGDHGWHIDVSLADRDAMTFDLIICRTALKGRKILVDPSRSFLSELRQSSLLHQDEVQNLGNTLIERKNQ